MLGHVLKLSAVGYEQFPCACVRVRRNEFNSFLNMYFSKPTDFWALTKEHTIAIGDLVLIRKLDTSVVPTVMHSVEKVVLRHGHLVDPITKKRVICDVYEDELALRNNLVKTLLQQRLSRLS
uniref:Uncharacterized protein n=1 Tax=Trichuris muris TaxID=70415 RepID=A0A5S6QKE1_TRIMR